MNLLYKLNEEELTKITDETVKQAEKLKTKTQFFTAVELNAIVDFMINHKEFARNGNIGPQAVKLSGKLWVLLTRDVSNCGIQRTVTQVINAWSRLKKKALAEQADRVKALNKTGNVTRTSPLSELSAKVLSVIGTSSGLSLSNGQAGLKKQENSHVILSTPKQKRLDNTLMTKDAFRQQNFEKLTTTTAESNQHLKESNRLMSEAIHVFIGIRNELREQNKLKRMELKLKYNRTNATADDKKIIGPHYNAQYLNVMRNKENEREKESVDYQYYVEDLDFEDLQNENYYK
uniref:SucD protein n=1 Tax=Fopius arisanus TaxID=64838 RepID=A0A0C9R643_9HYME